MPAQRAVTSKPINDRAIQLQELLDNTVPKIVGFVDRAEDEKTWHQSTSGLSDSNRQSCLVNPIAGSREQLEHQLRDFLAFNEHGSGSSGLQKALQTVLTYSVNTSAPGFLDKLYAAPLPPGIAAELVLGVLNTNLHVYQVSPVLTLIEKHITRSMAAMFGLDGPRSGGISVQGGSASNMTSIVIARNTLFPQTKVDGNSAVSGRLLLFTSAHGHYSIEKAAQALGFGSNSVIPVPVDGDGRMIPLELDRLVAEAKTDGKVPFYVNATAGSTVLGSFDPFEEIHQVAKKHKLWFHIDGAWGGSFVFSNQPEIKSRLRGSELADSIATNPHKMLGVPVTCSFLLAKDLKHFQEANTLKAGYLFHDEDSAPPNHVYEQQSMKSDDETAQSKDLHNDHVNGTYAQSAKEKWKEPYDLADLTLQCGRRGDSLKFFFSWKYYGTRGYSEMVDNAYSMACYFLELVQLEPNLTPVLAKGKTPSCLQVCFWFTPSGRFSYGLLEQRGYQGPSKTSHQGTNDVASRTSRKALLGRLNSQVTANIAKALIPQGFMIDFAPALEGQEDKGSFFRVVVNISTIRDTVQKLLQDLVLVGNAVVTRIEAGTG